MPDQWQPNHRGWVYEHFTITRWRLDFMVHRCRIGHLSDLFCVSRTAQAGRGIYTRRPNRVWASHGRTFADTFYGSQADSCDDGQARASRPTAVPA